MPETLIITEHAQFYRATNSNGDKVFFPQADSNSREAARKTDEKGDPPIVAGFAVYDTSVATTYAVALYPTKTAAQAHKPAEPTPTPETIFEDDSEVSKASLKELRERVDNGEIETLSPDAPVNDGVDFEQSGGGKYPAKKKAKVKAAPTKTKKAKKPIAPTEG